MAISRAVDRWIGSSGSSVLRTLRWVLINLGIGLLSVAGGIAIAALPPLSLLPTTYPLEPADVVWVTVFLGGLAWPVHLVVLWATARLRRARLWALLTVPVLALPALLIPFLGVFVDDGMRAVVLAYLFYGALCRLHPRRWGAEPSESGTGQQPARTDHSVALVVGATIIVVGLAAVVLIGG